MKSLAWLWACLPIVACQPERQEARVSAEEAVVRIDLQERVVRQPVAAAAAAGKFVQVEIVDVDNPKRIRHVFEVHYEPPEGESVLLGTFSLFPPDRPGTFIVATEGRVRPEGTILLSLKPLDEVSGEDRLRIGMRPLRLTDGPERDGANER
jgi:hypothetical protein